MKKAIIPVMIFIFCSLSLKAQKVVSLPCSMDGNEKVNCLLTIPLNYDSTKSYPLIVFLNGKRNLTDISSTKLPHQIIRGLITDYFILCPIEPNSWYNFSNGATIAIRSFYTSSKYNIDTMKIYIENR